MEGQTTTGTMSTATLREINIAIFEYVKYHKLEQTVAVFEQEIMGRFSQILSKEQNPGSTTSSHLSHDLFLQPFDQGNREAFFSLMQTHFDEQLLTSSETIRMLFYFQIYFAVYALRDETRSRFSSEEQRVLHQKSHMKWFQHHLETNQLAQTSEFLPYFALPFLPDPSSHPSFVSIFLASWNQDLRQQLVHFLQINCPEPPVVSPQLHQLFSNMSIEQGERSPDTSETEPMQIRVSDEKTKQDIHQIGEERQSTESSSLSNSKQYDIMKLDQPISTLHSPARKRSTGVSPRTASTTLSAPLFFSKIQKDLMDLSALHKCVLLQALRWRLNKTRNGKERRTVLMQYVNNDVLCCKQYQRHPSTPDVLSVLLLSRDTFVQDCSIRLVNCLATNSEGRAYLLTHPNLIDLLFSVLKTHQVDNGVHQNALGALQKFSLRRSAQSQMIELGVVEHITHSLADYASLSEYSIEYGTALLMNLSLRSQGKVHAETCPKDILKVLTGMMEYENPQVKTYINGTLYSVLTQTGLKERARAMGLEEMLLLQMQQADEQYERQISFILQQLKLDQMDEDEAVQSDDNEEEEMDYDEEEEDEFEEEEEDELSQLRLSCAQGEKFLCSNYLASEEDAHQQMGQVKEKKMVRNMSKKEIGGSSASEVIPKRPMTPKLHMK